MNKYYQTLEKILQYGKTQENKKGHIKYLLNERSYRQLIYLIYLKAMV